MGWFSWVLVGLYVVGFVLMMHFQITMAPNATLGLMGVRAGIWPIYWATGWPHGVPLRMD